MVRTDVSQSGPKAQKGSRSGLWEHPYLFGFNLDNKIQIS